MKGLDSQIRDLLDVSGLVLVLILAYLGSAYTRLADLLEESRPDTRFLQTRLANKLLSMRRGLLASAAIVGTIAALSAPVWLGVLTHISFTGRYSPLRAGFLFIVSLLMGVAVAAIRGASRAERRRKEVLPNPDT